ncbi:MAG: crosslink repair DNA glycosylase YcaQ family protein [Actinomycetota bacterium]
MSDLCGVHGQLTTSAELALLARVEGLQPNSLRDALWRERSLVKLWAMRGTLHVLPSEEYPMWQAALGTAKHYRRPVWLRAFGVTERELERLLDAVEQVLDGKQLTRDELADEVARVTRSKALGSKLRESWGVLLKPASFTGRLCFAPDKGRNVRFTGPRRWLRLKGQPIDPEDAYPEIVGGTSRCTGQRRARTSPAGGPSSIPLPPSGGSSLSVTRSRRSRSRVGRSTRWRRMCPYSRRPQRCVRFGCCRRSINTSSRRPCTPNS